MNLWLAGALVALFVLALRPSSAAQRLERWRPEPPTAQSATRTITARDVAIAIAIGTALAALRLPLVVSVFGGLLPYGWSRTWQRREFNRLRDARESAVADVTFALAGELRAGRTPSEALRAAAATAGPLADALLVASASVATGGSAAAELAAAARLPGAERLRSVASAWRVTESAGGRVALVLDRLGEAMDRDDQVNRELAAALAAPRATMFLLAGLPLLGLGMGQAIGAHPFHLLLYEPLGWGLLVGAAALDAVGIFVSRRIAQWALKC